VRDVLAVFAAGLIGYALGGWVGVAVGACSATAVSVLLDPLTPPGDRLTAHERRMRKNRRYRLRYEALEENWRNPYRAKQRTNWKSVDRLVADGRVTEPRVPIEIVPIGSVEELTPVDALDELTAPEPAPKRKRAQSKPKAAATPKPKAKATSSAKPTTARKPRTPRSTRAAAPKPT
jgi:hypothetical protein